MKSLAITLALLALAFAATAAPGPRTDINPALQYFQAFSLAPDLSAADHGYLFTNEWRGQHLGDRFGRLISTYDNQFKLLQRARLARVPCDWGVDFSDGPELLLPGLARAKAVAQTARLRVLWHLQHGRQPEAREDLLATFALAHNLSHDRILISALVQIAMENIVASIVAENFHQLTPATLQELVGGFDASPPRGTVAQTISTEQAGFHDWYLHQIQDLKSQHPDDDPKAVRLIKDLFSRTFGYSEGGNASDLTDRIIAAGGGSSEGVLRLLSESKPLYGELGRIMALPLHEYEQQIKPFSAMLEETSNPLVPTLFGALPKCRVKEFAVQAKLAMVRAAVAYRTKGKAGLNTVADPFSGEPFAFRLFLLDGVERGFELKSAYAGRGFEEVLIFVTKDGPPFHVDWTHAGQPLPNSSPAK